jgi:DNA-directed RNA polymerase
MEWAGYKAAGNDFVSHLPVALDGSCNGIQHLTTLMRDEKGAVSVNLVANGKPHDIYNEVAQVVKAKIDDDMWPGRVDRALMKRNVMTLPYGVKRYGMREQLLAHLEKERMRAPYFDRAEHDEWHACHYLSGVVDKSIRHIVGKACECMDWLVSVARVAAKNDLPVQWTAPSGLLVQQRYLHALTERVAPHIGEFRMRSHISLPINKIDARKQANGISPNFIHSLDAAHLVATVNLARENDTHTVDSFAMVHDSFGCHAGDTEAMMSALRVSFVEMYSEDLLTVFRDEILEQLPEELWGEVPAVPKLGEMDLSAVRESDFFFS